ncbi:radical SAM protein [bacterium]|nr:radical SAM protein [bacterium]
MQTGIVFDLKEFAVHDGPGIRLTVFLKGCPLSCAWCHNPEGLAPGPEISQGPTGPRRIGREYSASQLAGLILEQRDVLQLAGGGVTFSGGEPLMQTPFLLDFMDRIGDLHKLLDTSGYASEEDFRAVARKCDLIYFDLKLTDDALHRRWTGKSNAPILRNLRVLNEMPVPAVIRVPLVPGVTDTSDNLAAIARLAAGGKSLWEVHLLPYNRAAGGKYEAMGRAFAPQYDESRAPNSALSFFEDLGVRARIR